MNNIDDIRKGLTARLLSSEDPSTRQSSDSLDSFFTAHSHVSEENSQEWSGWISTHIHSLFGSWLEPVSQEATSEITIEEGNRVIEEHSSSQSPLPEWVEPLFHVLKQTVGERPSMANDHQQRLFFNPETGNTAWQCIEDAIDGLMEHKPLNSFYEILEKAVKLGHDNPKQPVLKQIQQIMQSPISFDFFNKAFVIPTDDSEHRACKYNYVFLVDRKDVMSLKFHPHNPKISLNIQVNHWTNSEEDNEYIASTLPDESIERSSEKWRCLRSFSLFFSATNLLITPLVAICLQPQYGSIDPCLHAVTVTSMPTAFGNYACSLWISSSLTIGLPIDCFLTGLFGLVLFNCFDEQETPSEQGENQHFHADNAFNRLITVIRTDDTFKPLIDEGYTPELAPETMRMSR
ncbi:MAG: hypothetical protein CL816_05530 [Coxiellaceae bacterium]|nr:hypothetical protein [Coxiellaceae bacterium]